MDYRPACIILAVFWAATSCAIVIAGFASPADAIAAGLVLTLTAGPLAVFLCGLARNLIFFLADTLRRRPRATPSPLSR